MHFVLNLSGIVTNVSSDEYEQLSELIVNEKYRKDMSGINVKRQDMRRRICG